MQVRVECLGNSNLPDSCYVSVRFGDVQKQSQYDPSKIYRFAEKRRFGKVDLYQKVGTCDVNWNMNEPHDQVCHVNGPLGAGIELKVSLGAVAPVDIKNSVPTPREARAKVASDKARTYLHEHGIENLLAGTMRSLLKVMPEDPSHFIIDYIEKQTPPKTRAPVRPATQSVEDSVHHQAEQACFGSYDIHLADSVDAAKKSLQTLNKSYYLYQPSVASMASPLLPPLKCAENDASKSVWKASQKGSHLNFCAPPFAYMPSVASMSSPVLTPFKRRTSLPHRADVLSNDLSPILERARAEVVRQLESASKDGRFEAALVKASDRKTSNGACLAAAPLMPSSIREEATHILVGSSESGRLDGALQKEGTALLQESQPRDCLGDGSYAFPNLTSWSCTPSIGTWLSSTPLSLEPVGRKAVPSATDTSWRNVPSVGSWMSVRPLPLRSR
jgi:hypothetical protein